MRILYLASSLSPTDGYGRYSGRVVAGMAQRGHEVVVAAPPGATPPEHTDARIVEALEPPRRYWQSKRRALAGAWRVRALARDVDLIHCLVEPYYGIVALGRRNAALVLQAVGTYVIEPFLDRRRAPWGHARAIRRADAVVAISRYTLERLCEHASPSRTEVVYLGVDSDLAVDRPVSRSPHPLIVTVGAVKPRKGTLELIRAMAHVVKRVPEATLHIVGDAEGDPEYTAACRECVRENGLTDRVIFRGVLSDTEIDALERTAWCFAMCPQNAGNKFEGFGLVYLEAAARGLPCVATRGSGAAEAVVDGETGLIVDQGDPSLVADAVARVLQDEPLRDRMGRAGREFAKRMSWDACLDGLERVYNEVLQQRGARRR